MKTMKDIEQMKNTHFEVFGTQFNYVIDLLFDWYIAKLDGQRRIERFLEDWDEESKLYWIERLNERIEQEEMESEMIAFENLEDL